MSWCPYADGWCERASRIAPDNVSFPSKSVVVFGDELDCWVSVWGNETLGERAFTTNDGSEISCFAIRLSDAEASIYDRDHAILLGVSGYNPAKEYREARYRPPDYGAQAEDYGIMSSQREWADSTIDLSALGMCAVNNGRFVSPILSTHPAPSVELELLSSSGFSYDTATVGIVCNLTTDTFMMYLNDQIVRTTHRWYQVDAPVDRPTEPFEWEIYNLRECRLYLASLHTEFTAEIVEWMPPPIPPSKTPPRFD